MEQLKINNQKFLPFIYLIFLSLIPLIWFREGYLINGTDVDFSINNIERLKNRLLGWDFQILGGTNRSNNIASLPAITISAFFELFVNSSITVQKLTYCTFSALLIFSTKYFLDSLERRNSKVIILCKLLAVTFVFVNLYNQFLWVRLQLGIFALAYIFLIFGILFRRCSGNYSRNKTILLAAIATTVSGPLGIQPPIIMIIIGVFLLIMILLGSIRSTGISAKTLLSIGVELLLGAIIGGIWWMLPVLSFIWDSGYGAVSGSERYNVEHLVRWVSSNTNFLNTLILFGDAPWFDEWGGEAYYPTLAGLYQSKIFIFGHLCFVALICLPILLYGKNNWRVTVFSAVAVFAIIFARGGNGITGPIYVWLIENLPFFWIQRAPWQKFSMIIVLAYSILLVFGFRILILSLSKFSKRFTKYHLSPALSFSGILLVLVGLNYPFVFGKMFIYGYGDSGFHQKNNLGFHQKYPPYLRKTGDYLNKDKEQFNILVLPDTKTNVYEWGYGGASDVAQQFINKGFLFREYGEGFAPANSMALVYNNLVKLFRKNVPRERLLKTLGVLNVKYILYRNDLRFEFYQRNTFNDQVEENLNDLGLTKISFGKWDLHKVPELYRVGFLSSATSEGALVKELVFPKVDLQRQMQSIDFKRAVKVETGAHYISTRPLAYEVQINRNARYLSLSQNFSRLWRLYRCKGKIDESEVAKTNTSEFLSFFFKNTTRLKPLFVDGDFNILPFYVSNLIKRDCKVFGKNSHKKFFGYGNSWDLGEALQGEDDKERRFVVENMAYTHVFVAFLLSFLFYCILLLKIIWDRRRASA